MFLKSFFTSFVFLMASIRVKTLSVTFAPLIIAYTFLRDTFYFNLGDFLIYASSCLVLQIACNFTNEYYDYKRGVDNEERKGPIRMLQKGKITHNGLLKAIVITFILPAMGAIYLAFYYGVEVIFIAILSLLAAFFYTGGKNPYGYRGLGEILAFIFFGPVIVFVPFFLFYSWSAFFSFSEIYPLALGAGSFAWVLLAINNLRDYDNDSNNQKMTLTVILGKNWTKVLIISFLLMANIFFYLLVHQQNIFFLTFFLFAPFIIFFILREEKLNKMLALTSLNYFYISLMIFFFYTQ